MRPIAVGLTSRRPSFLLLVTLALLAGACGGDSSTGNTAPEPSVATLAIVLPGGSGVITVTKACSASSPMQFNGIQTLSVTFSARDAHDAADPLVTAQDFEVQVGPTAGIVTAASTGAFSATFSSHGGGNGNVTVALHHKSRNHDDFGPCNVPVAVN